jgi:hypothetical protein
MRLLWLSNGDWKPYCDIKPSPRLIGSIPPFVKDHFFHGLYWLESTTANDDLLYLEKWGYEVGQTGCLELRPENMRRNACPFQAIRRQGTVILKLVPTMIKLDSRMR